VNELLTQAVMLDLLIIV